MTVQEMVQRLRALGAELDTLAATEHRSADQDARIDALMREIADLGEKVKREKQIDDARKANHDLLEAPVGPSAARTTPLGDREPAAGQERRDLRSPMARFLDSDAYRNYLRHPKGKSDTVAIGSFQRGHMQRQALEFAGDAPISGVELRALLYSGTLSADFVRPDVFPGIYRGRDQDLMMRDVLVSAQTQSDAIIILQESGFTNAAAETPEATATSGGGYTAAAKPESALTFTQVTYPVRTIAHWIPVTRQALADAAFLRSYVEARLIVGLQRRENSQALVGNGTGENLTGLYNTSGIQDLDAAYFAANPVENAGVSALENFDRVLRGKRMIATAGDARATFLVLNPADHERYQTKADANDRYIGTGPFAAGNVPTLWGLPVVEDEDNPEGHALVGDGLMAAVVDRMDATIYASDSHADFFTHNMIAILAEERIALPVFRPAAFADVELV